VDVADSPGSVDSPDDDLDDHPNNNNHDDPQSVDSSD
jgi:hypothetical protein